VIIISIMWLYKYLNKDLWRIVADYISDDFEYYINTDNSIFVELLSDYKPNKINMKNNSGQTALIHASKHGRFECVKILLKYGADVNIIDAYGNTALIYASLFELTKCAKILLKYSLDSYTRFHNKTIAFMDTFLFGVLKCAELLTENTDI